MSSKLIVKNEEKIALAKDFLFHSRNGVSFVSEIRIKQIRVNQRVGVLYGKIEMQLHKGSAPFVMRSHIHTYLIRT